MAIYEEGRRGEGVHKKLNYSHLEASERLTGSAGWEGRHSTSLHICIFDKLNQIALLWGPICETFICKGVFGTKRTAIDLHFNTL